jgi:hypothetical protein
LEEWREDIAKYMSVRQVPRNILVAYSSLNYPPSHPNIIQICGAATSNNIHATVFHDGVTFGLKWITVELDA